jgi:hypothetical protein
MTHVLRRGLSADAAMRLGSRAGVPDLPEVGSGHRTDDAGEENVGDGVGVDGTGCGG